MSKHYMDSAFYLRRYELGVTVDELMTWTHASRRTVYHWDKTGKAPRAVCALVEIIGTGIPVGPDAKGWENHRFRKGALESPNGYVWQPHHLEANEYTRENYHALCTEHRRLLRSLDLPPVRRTPDLRLVINR